MMKNFVKESLLLLKEMYKKEEDEPRKQKLNLLILSKESRVKNRQDLSQKTGYSLNQLNHLIKNYQRDGLDIFLGFQKRPKKDSSKSIANIKKTNIKNQAILPCDGQILLYENFFDAQKSNQLFNDLLKTVEWRHDTIKHFGREIPLPRLTAWYGDAGKIYTYSKIKMEPLPWTKPLSDIKYQVEKTSDCTFNSVLINQYRDGRDSVAWHSDDEKELGENPVIASVSLGATRQFMLKHKTKKEIEPITVELTSGSLLVMKGKTQECWLHQIPKTTKLVSPRINLTFRTIID